MIPGIPAHPFEPHDDDEANADWMLSLIDESPDRLAFISMPHVDTDEEIDALEDDFRRAYELAKTERPDLAVKLIPGGVDTGSGTGEPRIVAAIHEHKWVAGACVHGCPDTRPVDGNPDAA